MILGGGDGGSGPTKLKMKMVWLGGWSYIVAVECVWRILSSLAMLQQGMVPKSFQKGQQEPFKGL